MCTTCRGCMTKSCLATRFGRSGQVRFISSSTKLSTRPGSNCKSCPVVFCCVCSESRFTHHPCPAPLMPLSSQGEKRERGSHREVPGILRNVMHCTCGRLSRFTSIHPLEHLLCLSHACEPLILPIALSQLYSHTEHGTRRPRDGRRSTPSQIFKILARGCWI